MCRNVCKELRSTLKSFRQRNFRPEDFQLLSHLFRFLFRCRISITACIYIYIYTCIELKKILRRVTFKLRLSNFQSIQQMVTFRRQITRPILLLFLARCWKYLTKLMTAASSRAVKRNYRLSTLVRSRAASASRDRNFQLDKEY